MRVCVALFLSLILASMSVPARAAPLPTEAEITLRNAAAIGAVEPNFRDTVTGDGSIGATTDVTLHIGDDERELIDVAQGHRESGTFKGERWRQDLNGLTYTLGADPIGVKADPVTTTVSLVHNPVDAFRVDVLNIRGFGRRTYYDPASYLIQRVETIGAGGIQVRIIDAYEHYGARLLPSRWRITNAQAHLDMSYQRTARTIGDVTAEDVQKPPSRRVLVDFPAGQSAVRLPATFSPNGIYLDVTIGNTKTKFALDTGSSGIFIDENFARTAGLILTNPASAFGSNRFMEFSTHVANLHIGALQMHDVGATAGPMPIESSSGERILGVIGFDFLDQLGVTIDFTHATVTVVPAADYVAPSAATVHAVTMRFDAGGLPMVEGSIGGSPVDKLIFDTGCACQFVTLDHFTRRYPKTFGWSFATTASNGIGGPMTVRWYEIPKATVGGIGLSNVRVEQVPSVNYGTDIDGLFGLQLMRFFTIDLDYAHNRIYFTDPG